MEQSVYYPFVHVITEWSTSNFLVMIYSAVVVAALVLLVKYVIVGGVDD